MQKNVQQNPDAHLASHSFQTHLVNFDKKNNLTKNPDTILMLCSLR